VPLIVARLDQASPASERPSALTPALVSLVDLAPSLLALLGAPATLRTAQLAGRADRTLLDPRAPARERVEPVFCEKVERAELAGAVQIKAVRAADWKLIQRYTSRKSDGGASGAPVLLTEELYDLRADPLEARNLIAAPPSAAPLATLRRELGRFVAEDRALGSLGEVLRRQREGLEQQDPEAARILRALGY
jgi:arylsulfatase A-like enzyme